MDVVVMARGAAALEPYGMSFDMQPIPEMRFDEDLLQIEAFDTSSR